MEYAIIGILGLVVILLIVLFMRKNKSLKEMQQTNDVLNKSVKDFIEKYKPIINIEKEIENKKVELENVNKSIVNKQNEFETNAKKLNIDYQNAKNIYDKLLKDIAIYETDLELMTFGVYNPQYNFDTSEEFKEKLKQVLDKQKELISNKKAAICNTAWEVSGSKKLGQDMINRQIKLMLRAFNGECDTLIAKVKWNNIEKSNERILKAFADLNQLGLSNDVKITDEFLQLKISELKLTYEYELKKYEEKEEQRRIQEIMREEERAQREYEKAQQEAEKEELNYQKALEKAKKDLEKTTGAEFDKMSLKIKELEEQLIKAHEKKERALSMAQQTKSGYVYIISNIGSFGEDIYKIGMTRRLEPMDRVKELGDASVPFEFDVHAMIYSDNAPELEKKLHKMYEQKSVNLVNLKKEFFKVDLSEVEEFIKVNHNAEITITKLAQAKEYKETLAILEKLNSKPIEHKKDELPEQLFKMN